MTAARQRAEQMRCAAPLATGERRKQLYEDAELLVALSDELEAAEQSEHEAQTYLNELRHIYEDQKRAVVAAEERVADAMGLADAWIGNGYKDIAGDCVRSCGRLLVAALSPASPDTEATEP